MSIDQEYEVFLDENFSALQFANSLVLATNTPTDPDIDLDAATRRLGYDLEEVEQLMTNISTEDYELLLDQAANILHAQNALESVKTTLDHVNYSYSKLDRNVVKPYERAQRMHTALRRLHLTSSMLRALTWYLYLARQLNTILKPSVETMESNYKSALNLLEIRRQLEINPSLKSLQIIRAHENSLGWVEDKLKAASQHFVRTFTLMQDKSDMGYAFLTLYLLDPSGLVLAIDNYLRGQISSTVANFSKSLSRSIAGVEGAASDARNRARSLVAITAILEKTNVPKSVSVISDTDDKRQQQQHQSAETASPVSLLSFIKSNLDLKNLVSDYWRDVASGVDGKVYEFISRNPATARSWTSNAGRLRDVIRSAVINGGGVEHNGLEVKVMMNAVSALGRA